jgi:type VI secretion system protein ImpA
MATAAVIDIEALLAPIEGDNPAGNDLSPTGLFGELNELRRSDDAENLGDWAPKDIKTANWSKLIKVATEALTRQSKDLRVAVHLAEALVQTHGMAGLRDGLRLTRQMQERYWDNVYPVVDEDDGVEVRAAAVGRMDRLLPMPIRFVKVTKPSLGDTPLTHADWDMAHYVDNLQAKDQNAYNEAVAEGKPTGEIFRRAVTTTPRNFYERFVEDFDEAQAEVAQLNQLIEERYRDAEDLPILTDVRKALEGVDHMIGEIEKVIGPLRKSDEEPVEEAGGEEDGGGVAAGPARAKFTGDGVPLEPLDRADALRRLQAVAGYFRKAEPHSPITYLVERAIAWAGLPLDKWLEEVVKDETVLAGIRETLGVKPPIE